MIFRSISDIRRGQNLVEKTKILSKNQKWGA